MGRKMFAVMMVFVGVTVSGWLGCSDKEGGGEVDIRGLSAQQAASVMAEAVCSFLSECGSLELACSSTCDNEGHCTNSCEARLVQTDYQECLTQVRGDIQHALECANLTPEQQAVVNQCINEKYADGECPDDQELAELADRAEQGEEVMTEPAACQQMEQWFEACYPVRRDPENPSVPGRAR